MNTEEEEFDLFDAFDTWGYEFDASPPTYVDDSRSKPEYVDETVVNRWRAPPIPSSAFIQLKEKMHQYKNNQDLLIQKPVRAFIPLGGNASIFDTRDESPSHSTNSSDSKSADEIKIDLQCKSSQGPRTKSKRKRDAGANTREESSRLSTTGHLEGKIVEMLSYPGSILRAFNIGDFKELAAILDRSLSSTCQLRTQNATSTASDYTVDKVIPRDKIVSFFAALAEAVPDAMWRIQDTKLRKGTPKMVASSFIMSGTLLNCNSRDYMDTFATDSTALSRIQAIRQDVIAFNKLSGTIQLTLDESFQVISFDIFYLPPSVSVTMKNTTEFDNEEK